MGDFPTVTVEPFNAICNLVHPESMAPTLAAGRFNLLSSAASSAMVANLACYYPFRVWTPATARKMSFIVGATNTGNVDVGIYTAGKSRLVALGSTALGTANTIQECDIADTLLLPGLHFMAIQFSSSSGTAFRITAADENLLPTFPVYQEAVGSFGLPTTAAWALSTTASVDIVALAVHFDSTI